MQTSEKQVEKFFSYLKTDRLRSATRTDATLLEAVESDRGVSLTQLHLDDFNKKPKFSH